MRDITIGEKVNGYSTALVFEEDGFRVSLGSTISGAIYPAKPVATCDVFGIYVVVTDEDKYRELAAACKQKRSTDVRRLLVSFVIEHIAAHPEVFTTLLEERFEEGVHEGERRKAREIRRALDV
jgi:hypothetical protein